MEFTPHDFKEVPEIAKLQSKIDNMDAKYVYEISDEIFQKQPFLLSVLLGYRLDTTPEELEELMKVYFMIWEYFKSHKNVQSKKVTETYFEKIQRRNIQMLKYTEGEPENGDKLKIFSGNLQNLKSKALFAAISFKFNNSPGLSKMDAELKGIIIIGIKSFIECFETI